MKKIIRKIIAAFFMVIMCITPVISSLAEGDDPCLERDDYIIDDNIGEHEDLTCSQLEILNEVNESISRISDEEAEISIEEEMDTDIATFALNNNEIYTNAYMYPNNPRTKVDIIEYDKNGKYSYVHSFNQGRLAHLSSANATSDASNVVEDVFCELSWLGFHHGLKSGKKASDYPYDAKEYLPQEIQTKIALSLYYFDNFFENRNNLPPHFNYFFKQCLVWYWTNTYKGHYKAESGYTRYEVGNGQTYNGKSVATMFSEYFWGAVNYANKNVNSAIGNIYVYVKTGQPVCTWDITFLKKYPEVEIQINKVNEVGTKLPDAEFTIYTDEACTKVKEVKKTDANGIIKFGDIKPDIKYYICETKAPKGYNLIYGSNNKPKIITFEYKTDSSTETEGVYVDGVLLDQSGDFKLINITDDNIAALLTVKNYTLQKLPETGNIKRCSFTIIGLIIIYVYIVLSHKRHNEMSL